MGEVDPGTYYEHKLSNFVIGWVAATNDHAIGKSVSGGRWVKVLWSRLPK